MQVAGRADIVWDAYHSDSLEIDTRDAHGGVVRKDFPKEGNNKTAVLKKPAYFMTSRVIIETKSRF